MYCYNNNSVHRGTETQWVERWTCDQEVMGSDPTRGKAAYNNLGQVDHTYVRLSPCSITWYRPRGGDALWLRR